MSEYRYVVLLVNVNSFGGSSHNKKQSFLSHEKVYQKNKKHFQNYERAAEYARLLNRKGGQHKMFEGQLVTWVPYYERVY